MTDYIHVFVATPMYGGLAHQRYIESLMTLMNHCRHENINISFAFMGNESLITRARNALTEEFLRTDCTHLFFIDADIGFNSAEVIKMIRADVDIIAGVYPKKDINWPQVAEAVKAGVPPMELPKHTGDFVINVENVTEGGINMPTHEPFPVANAGTGLMLIKRKVFEELKDKVPKYKNNMTRQNLGMVHENLTSEFFATSIDEKYGVLLSEDYHFCQLWKKHGGQVFIAPWANLTHNGTYQFEGQLQRRNA